MSPVISTVSKQLNLMKEQLQKRQDDISAVKKQTERLNERLVRMEEELERQKIFARRNNIVFYGIPEVVHDREWMLTAPVLWSTFSMTMTQKEHGL